MKKFRLIFKKLLLVFIISGLITSNILTLLNDDIHATVFNTLKTVLTYTFTKETLSQIVSNSPTQKYSAIETKYIGFKRKRIETTKRISKRIYYRTEKHAIKSITSFLPKIAPLVGTITTATFTAMEINDDCQTIKDLNELNKDFEIEKIDETKVCGIDISSLKDYLPN